MCCDENDDCTIASVGEQVGCVPVFYLTGSWATSLVELDPWNATQMPCMANLTKFAPQKGIEKRYAKLAKHHAREVISTVPKNFILGTSQIQKIGVWHSNRT